MSATRLKRRVDGFGSTRGIACPIVTDAPTTGHYLHVIAAVTRSSVSSPQVSCVTGAYTTNGTFISGNGVPIETTNQGDAFLTMTFQVPANTATFILFCNLTEDSSINHYEYYLSSSATP